MQARPTYEQGFVGRSRLPDFLADDREPDRSITGLCWYWRDGETEIMPRFERGVPGSNPGRAAFRAGVARRFRCGVGGVAAAACLAVNQEVRVRLSSDTLLH